MYIFEGHNVKRDTAVLMFGKDLCSLLCYLKSPFVLFYFINGNKKTYNLAVFLAAFWTIYFTITLPFFHNILLIFKLIDAPMD